MEYRATLNLPVTGFPMKANLPQREPEMVRRWLDSRLYGKLRERAAGRPRFVLHDGPPYANGEIHLGTALNKVLKDFVVKFKALDGFDAPYVPGWDCHGLPIELKTLEENPGLKDPATLRGRCREYALGWVEKQKAEFIRLGVLGDWDNPYLTLAHDYEAAQLEVFATLVERGLVYRALKSIYWCPTCRTALAEAEIEYQDHKSDSIFVRFAVDVETVPRMLAQHSVPAEPLHMMVWTTTPWTLPANVAIAVHPEQPYGLYRTPDMRVILGTAIASRVGEKTGRTFGEPLLTFPGKALLGLVARHPFLDRKSPVVVADYVTMEDGTGAVHIAPGHGQEDFEVGSKFNLPVVSPIDATGTLTAEAGPFKDLFYEAANPVITEHLEASGHLVGRERIAHQYPHCWRCKNPVIYRASPQWFVSVDKSDVRKKALEAIEDVRWVPAAGVKRIGGMLENRPDWCISRQRVWGVPIPALYCQECEQETLQPAVIRHVAARVAEAGGTAWIERPLETLLPEGTRCKNCHSTNLRKEKDIMDVWFDSGVSHVAVLTTREELGWPADLYLEGSDQHRGWFQTSLLTSVGSRDTAPYRQVLTHGFVVDEDGRKMSKSIGNTIEPQEIAKSLGCDILRLWVASADYTSDIKVSKKILAQCTDMYRRIRNTLRFLLGNTSDFDPARHALSLKELEEMDRWALALLADTVEKVREHYGQYRFYMVMHLLHNLCAVELSAFYLDIIKDRLYCSHKEDRVRRSAQTALYGWLSALTMMLAPILSFTAEEVFSLMPWPSERPQSVFLADWPKVEESWKDPMLLARWEKLAAFKKGAAKALETAREKKVIGSSLEAKLSVFVPDEALKLDVQRNRPLYEEVCIVSKLELVEHEAEVAQDARLTAPESSEFVQGVFFGVQEAPGSKCERCWKHLKEVGVDAAHPGLCARCVQVVSRP